MPDSGGNVKTMRLRYAGVCGGCGCALDAGVRAHYLKATKTLRCLDCGPGDVAPETPAAIAVTRTNEQADPAGTGPNQPVELMQDAAGRSGACEDCGRPLRAGHDAMVRPDGTPVLCVECVTLDTLHTLGVPGAGARLEHAKRLGRHKTRLRAAHPRFGGVLLVLRDEPSHVRAWQTGAVGEEEFGQKLSGIASETLKVLHDRKIPRSAANIDHVAVTSEAVWVLDAKRYQGRVESRGHGLFSRRPPDLFVGGRNQSKLVDAVKKQVAVVEAIVSEIGRGADVDDIPVRGGLVFVHAEFGLFSSPFLADGVWVGWGKAIRKRLVEQTAGNLPLADIAKSLARQLRSG